MLSGIILPLTNLILGIVELLISLRIILRFFGASTAAPFVSWIYETTAPLISPFIGIFPNPRFDGRFVIEFSSLIALLVYAIIGSLIDSLMYSLRPRRTVIHRDI